MGNTYTPTPKIWPKARILGSAGNGSGGGSVGGAGEFELERVKPGPPPPNPGSAAECENGPSSQVSLSRLPCSTMPGGKVIYTGIVAF